MIIKFLMYPNKEDVIYKISLLINNQIDWQI